MKTLQEYQSKNLSALPSLPSFTFMYEGETRYVDGGINWGKAAAGLLFIISHSANPKVQTEERYMKIALIAISQAAIPETGGVFKGGKDTWYRVMSNYAIDAGQSPADVDGWFKKYLGIPGTIIGGILKPVVIAVLGIAVAAGLVIWITTRKPIKFKPMTKEFEIGE